MFSLEGKVALVTGASRGIGRAVALAFAAQGADVALCARTEEALEQVAGEVRELGRQALVQVVDVRDAASADAATAATVDTLGRLDILVNNAGITRDTLLMRMKDEDWEDVLATNLTGPFYFTRAAARIMLKQRGGRVLNISSVVGLMGNVGQANYAASKAGIIGVTKSLARELGPRGVTVNAIAPGFITTDMTSGLKDEHQTRLRDAIPLGAFGEPEDVAAAACYLASDAAKYVTGQVIQVDGGMRL
ncbi:3-oxoacyl-[acyl-carrier-protein] reductase [Candidatus Poribacteria bacterium]|jgi:3-oxoacyl-[acyl-carrier protein] reductase|nr:3-oxoacyl-[acyl-carrier-protein] reductase [Candidatus Poribacteria bacterium]MBT7096725.1 3-oxoacyl-[acyl-carrier-protein] reductase [Candidatus Poribacteria bacterium]MBT7805851.1 3-oxoacyl-[acyl-carrier-protein] reductase [Candidatus Poribacteria bacterium]